MGKGSDRDDNIKVLFGLVNSIYKRMEAIKKEAAGSRKELLKGLNVLTARVAALEKKTKKGKEKV